MVLSCTSSKVRLWADRSKQTKLDLPHALSLDTDMVYVDERYECRFYVEGCATSAGINDTELKVTYTRDSINSSDTVLFHQQRELRDTQLRAAVGYQRQILQGLIRLHRALGQGSGLMVHDVPLGDAPPLDFQLDRR